MHVKNLWKTWHCLYEHLVFIVQQEPGDTCKFSETFFFIYLDTGKLAWKLLKRVMIVLAVDNWGGGGKIIVELLSELSFK